jgi:amino acid transporter
MRQRRNLGLIEAIGLSIAILSPTISLSFNAVFTVKAAGVEAPLSFLVGTVSMLIVGLCFVAFERRIQGFGSVYSYVRHAFGDRWGYVAGWTLLLSYAGLTASALGLVGNGFTVLLDDAGVHHSALWMPAAMATLGIATWLCWQDTKVAVRGMLALEGVSVLIIVTILENRIITDRRLGRPFEAASKYVFKGTARSLPKHMELLTGALDRLMKGFGMMEEDGSSVKI